LYRLAQPDVEHNFKNQQPRNAALLPSARQEPVPSLTATGLGINRRAQPGAEPELRFKKPALVCGFGMRLWYAANYCTSKFIGAELCFCMVHCAFHCSWTFLVHFPNFWTVQNLKDSEKKLNFSIFSAATVCGKGPTSLRQGLPLHVTAAQCNNF
jgi:hypothetical protein